MRRNPASTFGALYDAAGPALREWLDAHRSDVESAAQVSTAREYRYGALNRPPGYATVPKGYIRVDAAIPGEPRTRHGVVVYDRPLTDEEVRAYELYPYMPLAEVVARVLPTFSDYGQEYADVVRSVGDHGIKSEVGYALDRLAVYTDIPLEEVYTHVAPELARRFPAAGGRDANMPAGFDSFDTDDEPAPRDYRQIALDAFRSTTGVEPTVFPASEVLREREDVIESGAYYTAPYMKGVREVAWLVFAPAATNETEAARIGQRILRNMTPRTKLSASSPRLLESALYVAFPGGTARVEPKEKRAKEPEHKGPSISEEKEEILRMLQPFGRGVSLRGNEEAGYILVISPTLRAHAWPTYTAPRRPLASVRAAARDLLARLNRTGGDVNAVMRGEGRGA